MANNNCNLYLTMRAVMVTTNIIDSRSRPNGNDINTSSGRSKNGVVSLEPGLDQQELSKLRNGLYSTHLYRIVLPSGIMVAIFLSSFQAVLARHAGVATVNTLSVKADSIIFSLFILYGFRANGVKFITVTTSVSS